jgi:hypothetical protein
MSRVIVLAPLCDIPESAVPVSAASARPLDEQHFAGDAARQISHEETDVVPNLWVDVLLKEFPCLQLGPLGDEEDGIGDQSSVLLISQRL